MGMNPDPPRVPFSGTPLDCVVAQSAERVLKSLPISRQYEAVMQASKY